MIVSPSARERSSSPSRSILSSTASAAAAATGFPPYVPPSPPTCTASIISARPVTARDRQSAARGTSRSGPCRARRPRPRSRTSGRRGPCRLDLVGDEHDAVLGRRTRPVPSRKPGAGTMNPPSPWIGSTSTAAMFSSPMCLCISSIAYAERLARRTRLGRRSASGTGRRSAGGRSRARTGPMPCLYGITFAVSDIAISVRPWNAWSKRRSPGGRWLARDLDRVLDRLGARVREHRLLRRDRRA